jgi:transcriptional regulator with XRE-family HTH domain
MTPQQLEAFRKAIGITQREMAELLQCHHVAYKRYATGARPIPRYIERSAHALVLLRELGALDFFRDCMDAKNSK